MLNLDAIGYLMDKYNLPNLDCILIIQMVYNGNFKAIDNYLTKLRYDNSVLDNITTLVDRDILKPLDKSVLSINFMDLYLTESFIKDELVSDSEVNEKLSGYEVDYLGEIMPIVVGGVRHILNNILNGEKG